MCVVHTSVSSWFKFVETKIMATIGPFFKKISDVNFDPWPANHHMPGSPFLGKTAVFVLIYCLGQLRPIFIFSTIQANFWPILQPWALGKKDVYSELEWVYYFQNRPLSAFQSLLTPTKSHSTKPDPHFWKPSKQYSVLCLRWINFRCLGPFGPLYEGVCGLFLK